MVDVGEAVAAFTRYWRDLSLSDQNERLQRKMTPENAQSRRQRYTMAKRYKTVEDIKGRIEKKESFSGVLLVHKATGEQKMVVEVGTGGDDYRLYQLTIRDVFPYAQDLIYFGKLELNSSAELENKDDFEVDTYIFFVPGTRVWRLERTVQGNRQFLPLEVDNFHTVLADDYKMLVGDGSVQVKEYSKSLWKRRDNGGPEQIADNS